MIRFFYILFLFSFLITQGFAQNRAVDAVISKYSSVDGFKSVIMSDPASVLMQNESGENAELSKDLLKGIKTIKALSYKSIPGKVSDEGKNFNNEIRKFNAGDGFTEIMSLSEGNSKVKSLVHKSGDKVTEFVMIVSGENEAALIWINGDINLQNVINIGKILQLRGNNKPALKGRNK